MSFIESSQKPKLVEGKMIERISKVQKILEEQNVTFTQQIGKSLFNFIIGNIGSLIVVILLIILLFYRYSEVQEKKKKSKKKQNTEE
jgi:predicted PurR-regulated permease PerM